MKAGNPYNHYTGIDKEEMEYFKPRRLYYAVVAIVEIHISAQEAAEAGVFGVLGEEPIRLVDPGDMATIAKFRDVWRRHQSGSSSDEELDVAKFFSTAIDAAEAYHALVEQWRRNVEKLWLWHKSSAVTTATRMEFFPNWAAAWDDERDSQGNPVGIPDGWLHTNWNTRELIREHPWVQTQLALMPRFEPVVMFRHCVGCCGSVVCTTHGYCISLQRGD